MQIIVKQMKDFLSDFDENQEVLFGSSNSLCGRGDSAMKIVICMYCRQTVDKIGFLGFSKFCEKCAVHVVSRHSKPLSEKVMKLVSETNPKLQHEAGIELENYIKKL